MKQHRNSIIGVALMCSFVFGFGGPIVVSAATTPSLGLTGTYGILSSTFTRNIGVTTISGDLGYTTLGGSGTHVVSGSTFITPSAQTGIDQATALTNLNNQACTFTFDY